MDIKPLLSIIIPVYNAEKYLKRCLDSIVSQDYKNLEVLLMDDGSADGSMEIARACAQEDNRIRPISVPHGGVSVARNSGLSMATGEYIMFVDADDWIGSGIVGHMMDAMLETEADLVTCNIKHNASPDEEPPVFQDGYTVCDRDEYTRIFFRIGSNQYVHFPVAQIYKKDLLPNPLYPAGIRIGEDVLGTYRAIQNAKKIVRLNEVGYFYFASPVSATSAFGEKDFDLLNVWDMVVEDTKQQEPDYSYAVLDRKRLDFTLLFRLVTEVPSKERKQKYSAQIRQLRQALKLSEKDLLHSPIVRSRKVLIFLMCHFFPLMSFMGNIYVKANKNNHKKLTVG